MYQKIFTLPIVKSITPHISWRKQDEIPLVVITHPRFRAAISLQGAQLLFWQPHEQQPIIWLSDQAAFKKHVAIRGGAPICWPWFGTVNTPSHGFARNQLWHLSDHKENENNVKLTFILKENAHTLQLWPHQFTLLLHLTLGEECKMEVESYGNFQTTSALHSYFHISNIDHVRISGLGEHYIDKVTNRIECQPDEPLIFNGQTDRVYTQPGPVSVIHDPIFQRNIEVHHQEASDVIVWNPSEHIASTMTDMSKDGYKNMVCVETGCVTTPFISTNKIPARLSVLIRSRKII